MNLQRNIWKNFYKCELTYINIKEHATKLHLFPKGNTNLLESHLFLEEQTTKLTITTTQDQHSIVTSKRNNK